MNLNDLSLTREQQQLAATARSFFASAAPLQNSIEVAESSDGGYDTEVWRRICGDLGLGGLALAEELGGEGASEIEQSVVLEEMGRALVRSPYLSSIAITAPILSRIEDEVVRNQILPGVLSGAIVATSNVFGRQELRLVQAGSGLVLEGEQRFVLDATVATGYLMFAAAPDGADLIPVWVDAAEPNIEVRPVPGLDVLRPFGTVRFHRTSVRLLGGPETGRRLRNQARLRAAYAVGSELTGVAQHCLDMAVTYSKHREQFGQPIGAFQVIQHKCADMVVAVESSRSASRFAAAALASDPSLREDETAAAAWAAAVVGGQAAVETAKQCVQIHGGIGYTWEHPAHRYLRRAKASQMLLGPTSEQLATLSDLTGLWPARSEVTL